MLGNDLRKVRPRIGGFVAVALFAISFGATAPAAADPELAGEYGHLVRELNSIAGGLESTLLRADVRTAERLYLLEVRAIRYLQHSANAEWPNLEAHYEALANGRSFVSRIVRLQERVQQHVLQTLDERLPGEQARRLNEVQGVDHYEPLFRPATPGAEQRVLSRREAYEVMRVAASHDGIGASDFHYLGPNSLPGLSSGQLAEWVNLGNGRVRFTTSGAKHPVIGLGRDAPGAGSMKLFRDGAGRIILAMVSNSSGNYKPGPASVEAVVDVLVQSGVSAGSIVVTSTIPAEPTLVKLLMKAYGEPRDRIRSRVTALRQNAGRLSDFETRFVRRTRNGSRMAESVGRTRGGTRYIPTTLPRPPLVLNGLEHSTQRHSPILLRNTPRLRLPHARFRTKNGN